MDCFDGRSHNERYEKPHQQVQLRLCHTLQLATGNLPQRWWAKKSRIDSAKFLASFVASARRGEGVQRARVRRVVGQGGSFESRLGRWTFRASISLCNFKFSQLATFFCLSFLVFRGFPLWKLRKFFYLTVCVCLYVLHMVAFFDSNNICILLLFLFFCFRREKLI